MATEEKVREVLMNVKDPEIGLDIVNLGLVYGVDIHDSTIDIDMTLTTPACPAGPQIIGQAQSIVEQNFPEVEEVNINLVWSPFWNPSMISEEGKEELGIFD